MLRHCSIYLALIICACFLWPAMADDLDVYIGGSISQTELDATGGHSVSTAKMGGSNTPFKLFTGVDLTDFLALEVGYIDFGESDITVTGSTQKAQVQGATYTLGAVLKMPLIENFTPFIKGGYHRWEMEASTIGLANNSHSTNDGSDEFWGLGIDLQITHNIVFRSEFERFMLNDEELDLLSVGLLFQFK